MVYKYPLMQKTKTSREHNPRANGSMGFGWLYRSDARNHLITPNINRHSCNVLFSSIISPASLEPYALKWCTSLHFCHVSSTVDIPTTPNPSPCPNSESRKANEPFLPPLLPYLPIQGLIPLTYHANFGSLQLIYFSQNLDWIRIIWSFPNISPTYCGLGYILAHRILRVFLLVARTWGRV